MSNVFSLLTLPTTSSAFSALRTTAAVDESQSASPLHKVPRLDTDSDSGSASRRHRDAPTASAKGVVLVRITGEPPQLPLEKRNDVLSNQLRRCIRLMLTRESADALPLTYERIYAICRYVVCEARDGEGLMMTLKLELEQCVGRLRGSLLDGAASGVSWIAEIVEACAWFEKQTNLLESVLTYLDRVHMSKEKIAQSVRGLAFGLFSSQILLYSPIVNKMNDGIKKWIDWERENRKPHEQQARVADLIGHLQIHNCYQTFESYYLELITGYYSAESEKLATSVDKDALYFLNYCTSCIDEEVTRSKELLPRSSWNIVLEAVERALLTQRVQWLAKEGLPKLLNNKDMEGLSTIYHLSFRVNGLKELNVQFKIYVESMVRSIVQDSARDEEMVDRLLEFKAFADRALHRAFADPVVSAAPSTSDVKKQPNKDFGYALIDAFTVGFKARRNKPAEMIAKHIDRLMRKGQRGASDAEFEAQLDAVLALYRFTDDKDVFRTFYHRALAKRLLLERSASDDFELAMLKKLKEQYDPEFSMGDHMFNDLILSRETIKEHHSRLSEKSDGQKLNVMILQQSFWPFSPRKTDIDLPLKMQVEIDNFANFYKKKHQGHKLDWDHGLGTANLRANFKGGEKELSVSLYQAVILLLFNETTRTSFADIKANTRMENEELRRTLQSLACGKKKVLKKLPPGRDVDDQDVFEFNDTFTDPRPKVHINSIQAKETPEESKRTQTYIEGDRKHYLDAAIVRIMKARKQLMYEQLKTETIEAVKKHFVPEVSNIKQRIESLVEQEYLRRDEEETNMYIYVA
ncbi:hypothetical protein EW146_g5163 [Bondarzewia mesenterica]|uniref:Cullin family profile domain-containing protein n=1 Tax=Bondarzewia mesenterica TaxID=1095465 RepID=A0A4S4LU61_9AGAM|nr:hypothetical protein EW146_g5163 [Bondarzewia mesenterica]